jgi:hypothetical protein
MRPEKQSAPQVITPCAMFATESGADAMTKSKRRVGRMHSQNPADAAWRYEQAQVDADIEGLPRDAEAEHLIAEMTAKGVTPEQQIAQIKAMFLKRKVAVPEMT